MIEPYQVEAWLDCPECGCTLDEVFTCPPGVTDVQEMVDAPVKSVICPDCGHEWTAEWEGWIEHESAG